ALPFVALADLFTILHNAVWGAELPRDGYSTYYQLVVPLAHVLTGIAGLLLIFALLSRYFSNTIAALATAATWCGTNAAYYISFDPTMPHAASMTFVAGMIWSADTIRRAGWSRLRALALGLCCGMMIGVRHHNVTWMVVPLIMLVPDLVRGVRSRRPGVGRDVGLVILAAGTAFLSLLPQIVVNLASQGAVVGHVAKWTPQWLEVRVWPQLFSPTTGLLAVYPLAAVALVGLVAGLWSRRASAPVVALVVGLAAIIYLNAAYPWCPSPRRYVCAVAVLAWGLAVVMQWAGHSRRRTALVTVLLGGLCVQSLSMLLEPAGKFF
ncbi:MAG: hypothetical protein GY842_19435, partial [bacterium]|nr:hypothetical protein [bacterium]